ncbi:4-hydroxybenzoate octaprenyltransferase [Salmonella bongori]|nr:4-hydroxybenzoate octaprenyltransferase [Salmonella bongori]
MLVDVPRQYSLAVAYDTQYAMVDRDDDIKIGIKSTAILFGRYDKLIIGILQLGVLALMALIGGLNGLGGGYYWSVLVAGALFAYQQKLIASREREACFKAFMNNNYVGLVLFFRAGDELLALLMSCRVAATPYPAYKPKIFNTSYQSPDKPALSGISGVGLFALRRALNSQAYIGGNQIGKHLIYLHRFCRFGIARIADIALIP